MPERVAEMAIGMHESRKHEGYTVDIQRWYCPNCAELITAYTSSDGSAKARCKKCGVLMTKKSINRRNDVIELVMPHSHY